MAEISANSMVEGTILKLTNDGEYLRGGRVLWIESKAENIIEGIDGGAIFDVTANSVRTGQIMRISGDKIQSANMIDLLSTSADMTDEGKIIHINASHAQNGTMIDIKSPKLTDGKVISLTAKQLTTGKILELIDNEALTSGKLLHMKTASSNAENPVQIELNNMTEGIGVRMDYRGLKTGTGLLIDSKDGSSLEGDGKLVSIHAPKQATELCFISMHLI